MFKFTHEDLNKMVLDALMGKPQTTSLVDKLIEVANRGKQLFRPTEEKKWR